MTQQRQHPVFTIGHSNHSLERFVGLVVQHGVTALADVRSTPFSRSNPQFNRDALEFSLKSHSIKYVFLGRELGARSDNPSFYEKGRVQYARLAQAELFRRGLERVVLGSQEYSVALMCAEREPLECHRTLLVTRALMAVGIHVVHIHGDGHLESHEDAMTRLVQLLGLPEHDLFRTQSELIEEAYAKQEERIAYVNERLAREARQARS